jgi:hypothetical protein
MVSALRVVGLPGIALLGYETTTTLISPNFFTHTAYFENWIIRV